jgi:hypothetical protein
MNFQIRYSKQDKFKNNVFTLRLGDTDYERLLELFVKLTKKFPDAISNPIYVNKEYDYATLKIKNSKTKFISGVYQLTLQIKHKIYNNKEYLNAEIVKSELIERIVPDNGTVVIFE